MLFAEYPKRTTCKKARFKEEVWKEMISESK